MTDGKNPSGELGHYRPFGCLHSVENRPIDGKRAETKREGRTKPTGVAGEENVRSTTFEKKPWTLATSGRRCAKLWRLFLIHIASRRRRRKEMIIGLLSSYIRLQLLRPSVVGRGRYRSERLRILAASPRSMPPPSPLPVLPSCLTKKKNKIK
jgi:hypothetical protein